MRDPGPSFRSSPGAFPGFLRRPGRGLLPLLLVLAGSAPGAPVTPPPLLAVTAPAVVPEYNAKAGYLLLFTHYVEWPSSAFSSEEAPIVIGVLGTNPFGDVLARTVQGLKSQGRSLEIRLVQTVEEAARCQVVFIARKSERDEAAWLRALQGKPVLTVIESTSGLTAGAVLALYLDYGPRGPKVAFSANLPAARAAGLKLSARMLAFAKNVLRDQGEPREAP